jgi:putative restriction endonuclease
MRGTVAVTHQDWYEFLRRRPAPEVNFWSPSDRRPIRAPEFSPFFFKLKAPHRAIAGFGYYARWSSLPPWLAWECFGEANGCMSVADLERGIAGMRRQIGYVASAPVAHIGCTLLLQPTFFPRDAWIPQPADWHDRTVTSQQYDLTVDEGRRIWEQCLERMDLGIRPPATLPQVAGPTAPRFGDPRLVQPRLGQGTFRVSVTDAYQRACAVTDEHSLPALDAAHIRSYADDGPHDPRNGILLRADLHRLFDKGYLTVTPARHLEVSARLRADFSNGRSYYPLHGQALRLPNNPAEQPAAEFLAWHNERVYLG